MAITRRKGGALLTVLWLSAALSAIAFALATTVRGETERTTGAVDGLRAYYLASGAIERLRLYMQWTPPGAPGTPGRLFDSTMPRINFVFPTGLVQVEIIPETARLNVNKVNPEEIYRILVNLGAPLDRAQILAAGIIAYRGGAAASLPTASIAPVAPTFQRRSASIEEIEELLSVPGMTPELFYGTYGRDAAGRLRLSGGLRDCLSVYPSGESVDVNTAQPAVLGAVGIPPDVVAAIVETRRRTPFTSMAQLGALGGISGRLRVGGNSIFTARATAQLRVADGRYGDLRRSVAAVIKVMPPGYDAATHILRWYDYAWGN